MFEMSVKKVAGNLVLGKLVAIQGRAEAGEEPVLKECEFILNCYKTFVNEEVAKQMIDLMQVPTMDLKEMLRGQMMPKLLED